MRRIFSERRYFALNTVVARIAESHANGADKSSVPCAILAPASAAAGRDRRAALLPRKRYREFGRRFV